MKRWLNAVFAVLLVLQAGAQASHISLAGPSPQLHLGVGTLGGTIDSVNFSVPVANVGDGTPVVGSQAVLIEVAIKRQGNDPRTVTLTADSSVPLSSGANTIPMTQISWTSGGIIPAGTYNGTNNQVLLTFTDTRASYEDTHTFSYANTLTVAAGTYTGRVTYTATVL